MELCYLLAFPDPNEDKPSSVEQFKGLKDAPYFQPIDIDLVSLGEETVVIEGYAVPVTRQRYDGRVQMAECRFDLKDPFAASVLRERARIQSALQNRYIPTKHRQIGMFEEYSILLVGQAGPSPDTNGGKKTKRGLTRLTSAPNTRTGALHPLPTRNPRSGRDRRILVSRVRYSQNELTLVDWEGAVIISTEGDFESDIVLLKIGNYQLLRYRMLDQSWK